MATIRRILQVMALARTCQFETAYKIPLNKVLGTDRCTYKQGS